MGIELSLSNLLCMYNCSAVFVVNGFLGSKRLERSTNYMKPDTSGLA